MTSRVPCLAVVALLIVSASAPAQVRDAVELLPAHTLACLEVRQPARLSREVSALVRGSVLDNLPRLLAKKREEESADRGYRYNARREMLGGLGLMLSPEMLNEAGRIGSGFVAVTGIGKNGMPEVVGVLQSGESNFPGIYMRAFLSFARPKVVGEVEAVSLYREMRYRFEAVQPGQPGQERYEENGPVMAQMPGLLFFGSSVDSLKDVIRRAKRKSAEASLANLRAYKDSAALRDRPGLFAYVDAAALEAKLEELSEGKENPEARFLATLQALVGKRGISKLLFSLTLNNGSLEGQLRLDLDKGDSPLLGLLPDRAVQRELLHFAPQGALLAVTGGLGEGEKRWKTLLGLLDTLYKMRGGDGDNRPSIAIREKEKKVNLHIDKDILGELSGAGFVVNKDWLTKPDSKWLLLLRATDADAAARLDKTGLPRLFSLGGEEVLTPTEEEVQGQSIKTIRDKRLPTPVNYGRRGSVLVIGDDRDRVAEALVAGAKKAGLLSETKVADALKEVDEKATAIGVLSSSQGVLDLLAALNRASAPVIMQKTPPGVQPKPVERPALKPLEDSKAVQAFRQAGQPMIFTLNRQPDRLVLQLQPMPLRRMAPRLLDLAVEQFLKPVAGPGDRGFGGAIDIAPEPVKKE